MECYTSSHSLSEYFFISDFLPILIQKYTQYQRRDSNPYGINPADFLTTPYRYGRKKRCSLDYAFTISYWTQVVGIQSLHIQDYSIQLGVVYLRVSPNQPTFTQRFPNLSAQIVRVRCVNQFHHAGTEYILLTKSRLIGCYQSRTSLERCLLPLISILHLVMA